MESHAYHPRVNGLSERDFWIVNRALRTLRSNPNSLLGAFLQSTQKIYCNTSKKRVKSTVELPGRRVRLSTLADFDLCELFSLKPMKRRRQFQQHHFQEMREYFFHTI